MARLVRVRGLLCTTIAVVWALSGRASAVESLRLVTDDYLGPIGHFNDDKAPGPDVEVLRQVFAAMGQDVSFEVFPTNRIWRMLLRGERDGMVSTRRTSEREQICSFPDEPTRRARWILFTRTADVGKLKFSSFDDLMGHEVAVRGPVTDLFEQSDVSPELWQFLREHHNMVETDSVTEGLRMLAAGRVDYTVSALGFGRRDVARLGLAGTIEPLLSRSVFEGGIYTCFTKTRVSPALVDAFSRALTQFKQTEAFHEISRKYFP
jgi:polar amino acid transport system substrate-binding protein